MRLKRFFPFALATAVCVIFVVSCATISRTRVTPPSIPGAKFVGNAACVECHGNITRVFPASPHARVQVQNAAMAGSTGCESCHGPGSKHVEAGGGRGKFIVNPAKNPSACYECHSQVEAEFHLPQRHPVNEGHMNCLQCHDPHGTDIFKPKGGLAMGRQNESCAQCHREQTRPFVFEHEAMREGCVVCHNPHGSINRKLLVQSDANLCLKCHAQVQRVAGEIFIGNIPHAARLRQGTCWSSGCHTAVHGSNVHPRMLF
jgi:predicted CXXCH cytochrome family protein